MCAPRIRVFCLALALLPSIALAQVTPPASVDPSRIEKRFERKERSPSSAITKDIPAFLPFNVPEEKRAQLAATRFVLKQVVITGATAYTPGQLEFAYADMLGKEISLLDAQSIIRQITDLYQKDKYVLSQAMFPPQAITDGILNVQVIEGYISEVILEGDILDPGRLRLAEAYAEQIKKRRPLSIPDMERYLLLMEDLPGAAVKSHVRVSSTQYGALELIVAFTHKKFERVYTLDNRGSKYIGPFQHTAAFTANSLLGRYDYTLARFITTSPTSELRFLDILHEEPIGDDGARLALNISQSHAKPGDVLKSSSIAGDSAFAQVKGSYPLIRTRRESFTARAVFDIRNTMTDINGNTNLSKDRLRVARLGGAYDFVDRFRAANLVDAQVSHGLNILNASESGANRSRANAASDFTKINLDVARTQTFSHNISLATTFTGQYASDPLLAAEQFTLGGATFGSAYDPSELSGDHGVAGRAELRYNRWPNTSYLQSYQAYGFYDIGRIWIKNGAPGANDNSSLASAGLGARMWFTPNLSGNAEAALPLTKQVNNQGGHGDAARLFFSVTGRF